MRRGLARGLIALLLAWGLGLGWFWMTLPAGTPVTPSLARTDGVVVLTGGRGRLEVAFQLMAAARAKRLLISGVHPTTRAADLAATPGVDPKILRCCVDLGRQAVDTIGNAVETATWTRRRGYHSIRLVTSDYHLPRAQLELHARAPDLRIVPHVVASDRPPLRIIAEYSKYLWRWAFLAVMGP